jgi:hypothetical protein
VSETYARQLPRLIAVAAQYLGWKPDEFWAATPRELHAALSDPSQAASELISLADIQHLLERDSDDRNSR